MSGSPDVSIMGGCRGGMTAAIVEAHLAVRGERRINSATMTVTMLDVEPDMVAGNQLTHPGALTVLGTPSLPPDHPAGLRL